MKAAALNHLDLFVIEGLPGLTLEMPHVLGADAANLLQPLVQAMALGSTAHEVARAPYWIHPALPEVVENALLSLPLED